MTEKCKPRRVIWEDVVDSASKAFSVFLPQVRLKWAKNAWEILSKSGHIILPIQFKGKLELHITFQNPDDLLQKVKMSEAFGTADQNIGRPFFFPELAS